MAKYNLFQEYKLKTVESISVIYHINIIEKLIISVTTEKAFENAQHPFSD